MASSMEPILKQEPQMVRMNGKLYKAAVKSELGPPSPCEFSGGSDEEADASNCEIKKNECPEPKLPMRRPRDESEGIADESEDIADESQVESQVVAPMHPMTSPLPRLSGLLPTFNKRAKGESLPLPRECWRARLPIPLQSVEPECVAAVEKETEATAAMDCSPVMLLKQNLVASRYLFFLIFFGGERFRLERVGSK